MSNLELLSLLIEDFDETYLSTTQQDDLINLTRKLSEQYEYWAKYSDGLVLPKCSIRLTGPKRISETKIKERKNINEFFQVRMRAVEEKKHDLTINHNNYETEITRDESTVSSKAAKMLEIPIEQDVRLIGSATTDSHNLSIQQMVMINTKLPISALDEKTKVLINGLSLTIDELKSENSKLESENKALKNELSKSNPEHNNLGMMNSLAAAENEINKLQSLIDEKDIILNRLGSECDNLKSELHVYQSTNSDITFRNKMSLVNNKLIILENENKELQFNLTKLVKEINKTKEENNFYTSENEKYQLASHKLELDYRSKLHDVISSYNEFMKEFGVFVSAQKAEWIKAFMNKYPNVMKLYEKLK